MSGAADRYEISLAPSARRAIGNKLPPDVAAAAVDFITGPLLERTPDA
jgi:mRNA interferase RelE/StbE